MFLSGFVDPSCFLNSSAEMCAGSLAPGCQILGIFATRSQIYSAHGCPLACLVPLLWRPGGPWDDPGAILGRSWDDPGTLEGTRKGPVRFRLGFYRFFGDFGDPFWELFLVLLDKRSSFFHIYFQVRFSVGFWV